MRRAWDRCGSIAATSTRADGPAMGTGSLASFALIWAAMTAAVMSPSTLPFVVSFARRVRRWPPGSVVLVAAYLLVWTGFGVAAYFISNAVSLPWAASTAAGLGITFAGLYSLTPLKRLGQDLCIEICCRRPSLPAFRKGRPALTSYFWARACSRSWPGAPSAASASG